MRDATPVTVYNFAKGAEVNVSGTWTLTGSTEHHIRLLGPWTGDSDGDGLPEDNPEMRWRLVVNSGGTVNLNDVDLLSSELVLAGGSVNGKNVGNTVESFGNLSDSWGPFDPVPIPIDVTPLNLDPSDAPDTDTPVVTLELAGDANGDGMVNLSDFSILASAFGGSDDLRADFSGNGVIDLADFSILAAHFGESSGIVSKLQDRTFTI